MITIHRYSCYFIEIRRIRGLLKHFLEECAHRSPWPPDLSGNPSSSLVPHPSLSPSNLCTLLPLFITCPLRRGKARAGVLPILSTGASPVPGTGLAHIRGTIDLHGQWSGNLGFSAALVAESSTPYWPRWRPRVGSPVNGPPSLSPTPNTHKYMVTLSSKSEKVLLLRAGAAWVGRENSWAGSQRHLEFPTQLLSSYVTWARPWAPLDAARGDAGL